MQALLLRQVELVALAADNFFLPPYLSSLTEV
jgi:hypothetical protein